MQLISGMTFSRNTQKQIKMPVIGEETFLMTRPGVKQSKKFKFFPSSQLSVFSRARKKATWKNSTVTKLYL